MTPSRRTLLALASSAAALSTGGVAQSASDGGSNHHGVLVRMRWMAGRWEVCVPADEALNGWIPGMAFPVEWVPLSEYLAAVESAMKDDRHG